jgi:hypothetical protein
VPCVNAQGFKPQSTFSLQTIHDLSAADVAVVGKPNPPRERKNYEQNSHTCSDAGRWITGHRRMGITEGVNELRTRGVSQLLRWQLLPIRRDLHSLLRRREWLRVLLPITTKPGGEQPPGSLIRLEVRKHSRRNFVSTVKPK